MAIAAIALFREVDASTLLAANRTNVPAASSSEMIAGRATVIDGDTIEIRGKGVRFDGIDAPESAQLCTDQNGKSVRCGARSAEALASYLIQSQPTNCRVVGTDQYGRLIGTCKR